MSLIWWYGLLLLLKKVEQEISVRGVILTVLLSMLAFLMPLGVYGRLLSFNRTIQMFPFFYVGHLCRVKDINLPFKLSRNQRLCFVSLAGVIITLLIAISSRTLHVLEFYNVDVWVISHNNGRSVAALLGLRCFLLISACVLSMVVLDVFKIHERIACLGNATLLVYVMQGVFAHILPTVLPKSLYLEIGIAFVIVGISMFLIKPFDWHYITNPVSTVIKNIKSDNNEVIK